VPGVPRGLFDDVEHDPAQIGDFVAGRGVPPSRRWARRNVLFSVTTADPGGRERIFEGGFCRG
jgi:hypothetical protein